MDRMIIYPGQIPLDTDLLHAQQYTMTALGMLMQAVLGTSTLVDGLACTPTSPASLQIQVAPGSIYSLQNLEGTAFSSLSADTTHQLVKQGIALDTQTFTITPPSTAGQSQVYLVEVAYQDSDVTPVVLPYYNASNPAQAYSGPNNSGVAQNTVRKGVCSVQVKAGVAATTGSQVAPAADAGWTPLYTVTVAQGQTTITAGNIATVNGAPFISEKLKDKISIPTGDARYLQASQLVFWAASDTGTANTYGATLSPAPAALFTGMTVVLKIAHANADVGGGSGASTLTITPQGGSAFPTKNIKKWSGGSLVNPAPNDMPAGFFALLAYDGTQFQVLNVAATLGALASLNIGDGLENDGSGNLRVKPRDSTVVRDSAGVGTQELVNAQTGTSYSLLAADRGKLVTFNNASAIAASLVTANYSAGWWVDVASLGVGAVTFTPTSGTIDGQSMLVVKQYGGGKIVFDGTNYFTVKGSSRGRIRDFKRMIDSTNHLGLATCVSGGTLVGSSFTLDVGDYIDMWLQSAVFDGTTGSMGFGLNIGGTVYWAKPYNVAISASVYSPAASIAGNGTFIDGGTFAYSGVIYSMALRLDVSGQSIPRGLQTCQFVLGSQARSDQTGAVDFKGATASKPGIFYATSIDGN